jgi:GTP cyclohydrolase IA
VRNISHQIIPATSIQLGLINTLDDLLKRVLTPSNIKIESTHLCMMMRGVGKQNSSTTTSAFCGEFEKLETRNEFMKLVTSNLH